MTDGYVVELHGVDVFGEPLRALVGPFETELDAFQYTLEMPRDSFLVCHLNAPKVPV